MNSKEEWAEVYNNGSPGSPDSGDVPVVQEKGAGKLKKKFLRSIDPRSISDDVERTPIQAGAAARSPADDQCATPVLKNQTDKFKAAMDPRSPSGLPRTPILVQDDAVPAREDAETPAAGRTDPAPADNVPKRGAMVAKKLEMEEKEEAFTSGEIVVVEKEDETQNEEEIVVDEKEEENQIEEEIVVEETETSADENSLPSATGKSLPRVQDIKDLPSDCRSPLLIESSSPTEAKTSSQKKSRIPLRIKQHQDGNAREDLATRMMKEATISDEQNSSVELENSEGSLII